jgi:hypothetical protein
MQRFLLLFMVLWVLIFATLCMKAMMMLSHAFVFLGLRFFLFSEIEIEIVYNMYRMRRFLRQKPYAPVVVSGPSQLCHIGNLQVRVRPLTTYIQPLQGRSGFLLPPGEVLMRGEGGQQVGA